MKYKQVYENEWVRPVRKGYKMSCCDCNLVHVLDFKLESYGSGKRIVFRARRDTRATAAKRRKKSGAVAKQHTTRKGQNVANQRK
jgi:hypothetical protein